MKDFKVNPYYIVSLSVAAVMAALIMGMLIISNKSMRVDLFLVSVVLAVLIFLLLYSLSIKVGFNGSTIFKNSLFGSKEISVADIVDISILNTRGRYVFILITVDNYIIISSILKNFNDLFAKIKLVCPDEQSDKMNKLSDDMFSKKEITMKIMMSILFTASIFFAIYYYRRLFS